MAINPLKWLSDRLQLPIDKAALSTEQAGPTSTFIRNPYGHNPAAGLTPERLAHILRASIDGFPEPYLALAEDMEERFPQYASVLATRKRAVAHLPVTVEAASEDAADEKEAALVRKVVGSAAFRRARIDVLDAIGKGFSATEIIWDTGSAEWTPTALKYRDPRFFEFDRIDPELIKFKGERGLEDLKPAGWITHRAKAKSGLTIRSGIARQAAWLFLFQSFNLKDWAIFCEAYGQPLRVGKYDKGATDADKRALLDALVSIGADFAAIIPLEAQIEFIKAELQGSTDLYERRANFIDQQTSKIVLGQTGTTDVIKGGGYASSKVHDEVRDDIVDSDAEQLCSTLNEQLVIPLIAFNFPARSDRAGFPTICIGRPEETDVTAKVNQVARLVPFGLQVTMAQMQREIGITPPKEGEDVLVAPVGPTPTFAPDETARVTTSQELGAAIDRAVRQMLADQGWEPLMTPIVNGLADELAQANSLDEAKAILQRRAQTMGLAAFTDMLAQSAFGARLAGQTNEGLT